MGTPKTVHVYAEAQVGDLVRNNGLGSKIRVVLDERITKKTSKWPKRENIHGRILGYETYTHNVRQLQLVSPPEHVGVNHPKYTNNRKMWCKRSWYHVVMPGALVKEFPTLDKLFQRHKLISSRLGGYSGKQENWENGTCHRLSDEMMSLRKRIMEEYMRLRSEIVKRYKED